MILSNITVDEQGIHDTARWQNRFGVFHTNDDRWSVAATNSFGVIGTTELAKAIQSIQLTIKPTESNTPSLTGVLLLSDTCSVQLGWVAQLGKFRISHVKPQDEHVSEDPEPVLDTSTEPVVEDPATEIEEEPQDPAPIEMLADLNVDQWNTVSIEFNEPTIRVSVNQELVGELENCETKYKRVQAFVSGTSKISGLSCIGA